MFYLYILYIYRKLVILIDGSPSLEVHSKMAKWEEPFDERRWGLLPRLQHVVVAFSIRKCVFEI